MIICHVCKAECDDEAELCPICGAQLRREPEEDPIGEEENILENPTLLASIDDIVSAEVFKDILKENAIPFTCSSEMGDNSIQVLFGGGFIAEEFYVSEADFEKANALYEDFLESEPVFEGELDDEYFEDSEDAEEN